MLAITVALAVTSFRRGYDLDAVAVPVVTAVGDMVTVPSIILATLLVRVDWAHAVIAPTVIALAVGGTIVAYRAERSIRRMLLEMALVLVLVPILDVLAGTMLESQKARLFALPGAAPVDPAVHLAGGRARRHPARRASRRSCRSA